METQIETMTIYSQCIEMEFGIEKMCHTYKEKWEKRISGKNKTNKSRMRKNAWKKGKLQVLGNIRILIADTIKQAKMKRKIRK